MIQETEAIIVWFLCDCSSDDSWLCISQSEWSEAAPHSKRSAVVSSSGTTVVIEFPLLLATKFTVCYCAGLLENNLWSFSLEVVFLRHRRSCTSSSFTVCRKNELLCEQLLWWIEQKSWPTLMPCLCAAATTPHHHPNVTVYVFTNHFYKRRTHACVGQCNSLQARTSGWKIFGKEVAEGPHVPPQRQLHCSLLMLPFKLGHVTPG